MQKIRRFNGNHFLRIASSQPRATNQLKAIANQMRSRGYNARIIRNKSSSAIYIRPSINRINRLRSYKRPRDLSKKEVEARIEQLTKAMTNEDGELTDQEIKSQADRPLIDMLSSWSVDDVINEMTPGFDTLQRKSFTTGYGDMGLGMSKPKKESEFPSSGRETDHPNWSKEWVLKNDPELVELIMEETGDSMEEIEEYTDGEFLGRVAYVFEDGGGTWSEIAQYAGNVAYNDTFYMATGQYIAPNEELYLNSEQMERLAYSSLATRDAGKEEIASLYDPSIGNRFGALSKYVERAKNEYEDEVVMLPIKTWKRKDKTFGKEGGEIVAAVIHSDFLNNIYSDSFRKKQGKTIEYPTEFNLLSRLGGGYGGGYEDSEAFYKYMLGELETVDEGWGFDEEIIQGISWEEPIYESTDLAFVNQAGTLVGIYSIPIDYKGDKLDLLPAPARRPFLDENWYEGGVEKAYFRGEVIFDPEQGRSGKRLMDVEDAMETAIDSDFTYPTAEVINELRFIASENKEDWNNSKSKVKKITQSVDSIGKEKMNDLADRLEEGVDTLGDLEGEDLRLLTQIRPSFREKFVDIFDELSMEERQPINTGSLADFNMAAEYFEEGEWAIRMGLPIEKVTREEARKYLEVYGINDAEDVRRPDTGSWDGDGLLGDLLGGNDELQDRAFLTDEQYAKKWNKSEVAMKNEKQFGNEIVFEKP
jgi:hypothetical protein